MLKQMNDKIRLQKKVEDVGRTNKSAEKSNSKDKAQQPTTSSSIKRPRPHYLEMSENKANP